MNERIRSHPLGLSDIEARLTLSIDEVASVLGLGRTAAYEASRRGDIPSRQTRRCTGASASRMAWRCATDS